MSEPGEVRGAPSKVDKMRTPELAAAVLAVKGAVQEVLGKRTTSSFVYNSKSKGAAPFLPPIDDPGQVAWPWCTRVRRPQRTR